MKYIIFMALLASCIARSSDLKVGDCVLGSNMGVWKLLGSEDTKYLFASYPVRPDSPVIVKEDISALKEVKCP